MKQKPLMIWLLGGYMWLFIHRPFEVWPLLGDLHVERIYMLITLAYWALAAEKRWVSNRLNSAFLFFWIVFLASWLLSPYTSIGSQEVEDYFKVALFYILVITTVHEDRDLKSIVVLYVVAVGLYMLHSLREFACGGAQWTMGTYRLVGVDKSMGAPNSFASTIVFSLTMVHPLWPECRTRWQRVALLSYGALGIISVLLTSSRTGFAGLVCLLVFATLRSKHRWKRAVLLIVAAPLIWICLPTDRQNRFLTLYDPAYGPANAQASAQGRIEGWHDGIRLWREYPMLGVGPGGFAAARGYDLQAHQLFGQVLGELGTLGAVAFGSVLVCFLRNLITLRSYRRMHPQIGETFESRLIGTVTLTVALLLFFGFGGHNLYRYTWLWFGGFEVIAMHCFLQRANEQANQCTSTPSVEQQEDTTQANP